VSDSENQPSSEPLPGTTAELTGVPGWSSYADLEHPQTIGRYRVERLLGSGGYGLVYLAHDDQLRRSVAIKVPQGSLVARPEEAESYVREARTVANLDHPHIVPVYDVGSTERFPCFVVSKYVDGTDLARTLKTLRLPIPEAAGLVATVAEALHYAHEQGLVHRDIKPSNILLDRSGKPFVTDFGLALREEDVGTGPRYAGTPHYMSPEQARSEGHRVDGRSDVFSLGIVFYELLAGRRPFRSDSKTEVRQEILSKEPDPLRQLIHAIPKELERICFKALSKRASDRYATARDMADDLRHFLAASAAEGSTVTADDLHQAEASAPAAGSLPTPTGSQAIKVVPKGLRSFDASDAYFFLHLLPGPRDRDGLPDAIRFWKNRIEAADGEGTFSVGLIYGPSGCGKSSLVKAGLLPVLARSVTVVYVEAAGDETEARLLKGLRRLFPGLPGNLDLVETLAALRRGRSLKPGQKVLLVLDQFEQWLHATRNEKDTELVRALRQCDGRGLQAVVMVRDDFWLAVSRFMQELEIRVREGENSRLVDLFDPLHARTVLAALGRAYGCLPDDPGQRTREQTAFIDQAVAALAQEGKVISVRLALFAELMKGRPWVVASLKEVGGVGRLESTFLRETFSATTAPVAHRYHQQAARRVLKALLPEPGSGIRAGSQPRERLLEVSGYAMRPAAFEDLLRILDCDLRLITPTSTDGQTINPDDADTPGRMASAGHHYQLTHDYVVRSLRDWLDLEDKQTPSGRAAICLRRRSENWQVSPENRQLPLLWEAISIELLTRRTTWTQPERRMMRRAWRYHCGRVAMFAIPLALVCCALAAWLHAQAKANNLLNARAKAVPQAIEDLRPYRLIVTPTLRRNALDPAQDPMRRLHAAVALAAMGRPETDVVVIEAAAASQDERDNIHAALSADAAEARRSLARHFARIGTSDPNADRARAVTALLALNLGDPGPAVEITRLDATPADRALFIEHVPDWLNWTEEQIDALAASLPAELRSALCAGLGRLDLGSLPADRASRIREVVSTLYQRAPDAGTHGAALYALKAWKEPRPAPEGLVLAQKQGHYEWSDNSLNMTMVQIPGGQYRRADPGAKVPVSRTIAVASFLLSDCEVSTEAYSRFREQARQLADWGYDPQVSPSAEHPVNSVSWEDAVLFLNWLSHREGLPEYYEKRGGTWFAPQKDGNGYRLPTGAEWEYACLCGSTYAYAFGDGVELLDRYAIFGSEYRTARCGSRLPNGWGLFDMHGNLWEWCDDLLGPDGEELTHPRAEPMTEELRVIHGGAFDNPARNLRATHRQGLAPDKRLNGVGFRVARSIPSQR